MNYRRMLGLLVLGFCLLISTSANAQAAPVRIIFMHHSTGGALVQEGNVRERLTNMGYEFWDHGYNDEGLTNNLGQATGINWGVPNDNTDPDGWYNIFNQPVHSPADNTFSHMLEYDVIIFKSCFPASHIDSDAQFQQYQNYFLSIRNVIDAHPDKIFIPLTTPPLVPNATNPEAAARARQWANYLTSPEYLQGHPNIFVFDIFSQLADTNDYLRTNYRIDPNGNDSHPNTLANQTVGPIFADFIDDAIRSFNATLELNNPPDNSATTTRQPVFNWTRILQAPGYELQLGRDNPPIEIIKVAGPSYTPPMPLLSDTYYWRVRVEGSSEWTDIRRVTISALPNATPELYLVTQARPTLTWGAISWAEQYNIQISANSSFNPTANPYYQEGTTPGSALAYTIPETNPLKDGVYYWRVQAFTATRTGSWSAAQTLIVDIP